MESQRSEQTHRACALPGDYDSVPGRFAANQLATSRFLTGQDVHPAVAERFVDEGKRIVLDIGGGTGTLARLLFAKGAIPVVVDSARHVASAPRPGVLADACQLPFGDDSFDGAAALFMLYHLDDPLVALREARRVLRPGGLFSACAPSRYNDPELADHLPLWGQPLTFDAENGPAQLGRMFASVEIERWDEPLLELPNRDAVALYLRGRGLTPDSSRAAADRTNPPLTLTKRGMIARAR